MVVVEPVRETRGRLIVKPAGTIVLETMLKLVVVMAIEHRLFPHSAVR